MRLNVWLWQLATQAKPQCLPVGASAMAAERKDVWASGDAYEPYLGRWSRLVAREFLNWLDVPANGEWLDVGSGTGGAVTAVHAGPSEVCCY